MPQTILFFKLYVGCVEKFPRVNKYNRQKLPLKPTENNTNLDQYAYDDTATHKTPNQRLEENQNQHHQRRLHRLRLLAVSKQKKRRTEHPASQPNNPPTQSLSLLGVLTSTPNCSLGRPKSPNFKVTNYWFLSLAVSVSRLLRHEVIGERWRKLAASKWRWRVRHCGERQRYVLLVAPPKSTRHREWGCKIARRLTPF